MLIEHRGRRPHIDESAYVAPSAVVCGAVTVGPGVRVLHGAVVTAEDGEVVLGENVVIMENALIRGRAQHPVVIADSVLVGPHAHVNGSNIGAGAFIATGASLYPGSVIGAGAEVRINGVVQVNSRLGDGAIVPIGWIEVGDPAQILSPDRHDEIWAIQEGLDFPGTVHGVNRNASPQELMMTQSAFYGAHLDDAIID